MFAIPSLDSDGEDPDASASREKKARQKLIQDEFEKRKGGKLSKKEEFKKEKERLKDEEDVIRTAKVINWLILRVRSYFFKNDPFLLNVLILSISKMIKFVGKSSRIYI